MNKTKQIILGLIFVMSTMSSCSNKLDLSTIKLDSPIEECDLPNLLTSIPLSQNGHLEFIEGEPRGKIVIQASTNSICLIDGDEVHNLYVYKPVSNLNYEGLELDGSDGVLISDYNGKIASITTSVVHKKTIELVHNMFQKLGEPMDIVTNEIPKGIFSSELENLLIKTFPKNAKRTKSEFDEEVFIYPQILVWDKGTELYQLTLDPSGDYINNYIARFSKKAMQDRIIIGYSGAKESVLFGKTLK